MSINDILGWGRSGDGGNGEDPQPQPAARPLHSVPEPPVPPADPAGQQGAPVGVVTQVRAAASFTRTAARANFKARVEQHGGLVNWFFHYDPPSVAQQLEYLHRRSWVTPGHEGGMFDRAGARYQRRFGVRIIALAALVALVGSRAIAAATVGLIASGLTVVFLCALAPGDKTVIIAVALALWAAGLGYLFAPSRNKED